MQCSWTPPGWPLGSHTGGQPASEEGLPGLQPRSIPLVPSVDVAAHYPPAPAPRRVGLELRDKTLLTGSYLTPMPHVLLLETGSKSCTPYTE